MSSLYFVIACGVLSIVYAVWAIQSVLAADAGNQRMQEIAAAIREGATAYLTRQYTTIAMVGVVVFIIAWFLLTPMAAIGFAIGAVLSALAGFIGMHVSVRANVRTAQAASQSLAAGLAVAFKSGAITGLLVAGLALLGVERNQAMMNTTTPTMAIVAFASFMSGRLLVSAGWNAVNLAVLPIAAICLVGLGWLEIRARKRAVREFGSP